jgi:hypothetical protein
MGYVVTDWGAQHAGIAGANAGLDMVMPDLRYGETILLSLLIIAR